MEARLRLDFKAAGVEEAAATAREYEWAAAISGLEARLHVRDEPMPEGDLEAYSLLCGAALRNIDPEPRTPNPNPNPNLRNLDAVEMKLKASSSKADLNLTLTLTLTLH